MGFVLFKVMGFVIFMVLGFVLFTHFLQKESVNFYVFVADQLDEVDICYTQQQILVGFRRRRGQFKCLGIENRRIGLDDT